MLTCALMKTDVVLVTGARGFVGRHLLATLADRYPDATLCLLDHPGSGLCSNGRLLEKEGREVRVSADLACPDDARRALERLTAEVGPPDLVFHLAAQAEVGRSFQVPSTTYEVNVVGTARLLEALTEITTLTRVLIPSSAQVYAPACRGASGKIDESASIGPTSHYGASKYAQEEVGRLFYLSTGLPVFISRAFNHIGPGQGTGFVVPDFARQIAMLERQAMSRKAGPSGPGPEGPEPGGREPAGLGPEGTEPARPEKPAVVRVGNLEARRDYLDVRDVVDAYLTVIERGEPGIVYNVAAGVTWSGRELLEALLAEAAIPITVEVSPHLLRPLDVPELVGDASRLRALGWSPRRDLRDTLRETLEYWRRMTGARLTRETHRHAPSAEERPA